MLRLECRKISSCSAQKRRAHEPIAPPTSGAGTHDHHTAAVSGKAGRIIYEAGLAGEIEQPKGCLFGLFGHSLALFGRLDQPVDALTDAPVQVFLTPADAH